MHIFHAHLTDSFNKMLILNLVKKLQTRPNKIYPSSKYDFNQSLGILNSFTILTAEESNMSINVFSWWYIVSEGDINNMVIWWTFVRSQQQLSSQSNKCILEDNCTLDGLIGHNILIWLVPKDTLSIVIGAYFI